MTSIAKWFDQHGYGVQFGANLQVIDSNKEPSRSRSDHLDFKRRDDDSLTSVMMRPRRMNDR